MNDIANLQYGYTAKAKDNGDYRFIRITDIMENGKLNPDAAKYVDAEDGIETCKVVSGDILMARTGATYGKTALIGEEDENSIFASFLIKIEVDRNVILPAYYWHFAQSSFYWRQATRLVSGGGQPQFNGNVLKTVEVPVPSIEEQKRIVAILDKFDGLVNGIKEGLPAEIKARRQQYEYYRDQLLTFKEIA